MAARSFAIFAALPLALAGCERADEAAPTPVTEPAPAVAPEPRTAGFVNRVWTVAESAQVEVGSTRVFLADGTLVMASANATPAIGAWRSENGRLTIIEDGLSYPADILELSDDALRIRMHSPGEPIEMLLRPAEQLPAEALASAAPRVPPVPPPTPLWGTAWRLERLGGAGVLDRAQATLEFPTEGRAAGDGSCNRFQGVVELAQREIRFGGIAATRKACPEAVMRQEDAYFAALRAALRYETDGQALLVYAAGLDEPLRFTAMAPPPAAATNRIARSTESTVPTLTGIWTVVAHHVPGVSALGDDAARAHHGESLRLTARSAHAPGARCDEPGYAARTLPAAEFLASEYRLAPDALAPLAGRRQLRVMDVSCRGASWPALGARLIEIDRDRALAPWDGTFFELARDRDFRAVGQEPGWQLEIRQGAEMRFTYDYGKGTAVTPAARVEMDARTGTRSYRAVSDSGELRVEIVPVRCTDAMSGQAYAATVTVSLNDRRFRGCGEGLAAPYQG